MKLNYVKDAGSRELQDALRKGIPPREETLKTGVEKERGIRVNLNYSKGEGEINPALFIVISGGTEREKKFLNEFECKKSFKSLKIIFVAEEINPAGPTPKEIHKYWQKVKDEGVIYTHGRNINIHDIDSIYIVTDVDHYEIELRKIIPMYFTEDYPKWIISNPDIEVWIYYCFKDNPNMDLSEVILAPNNKRSSLMKTINGRFNNGGGLDPRKAFDNIKQGIINAQKNYNEDVIHFPNVLSTQMWMLANDIFCILGKEYEEWKNKKMALIQSYKNSIC